jgi:RNA polymerase sigma-70 factor (ECF subfamily)
MKADQVLQRTDTGHMGVAEQAIARPLALSRNAARVYPSPMHDCSDQELMLRYQAGELAAFEFLYRRHNTPFYRYLLRLAGDRGTAEDMFQETWAKVIRARSSYKPVAQFSTYLYTIGHRCFIDHARKARRLSVVDPGTQELEDPAPSPAENAELALARKRLDAALRSLPDQQRDVFLLKEEAGLDLDAIAMVTGASREAVKSQLRYATHKLRDAMAAAATPGASA